MDKYYSNIFIGVLNILFVLYLAFELITAFGWPLGGGAGSSRDDAATANIIDGAEPHGVTADELFFYKRMHFLLQNRDSISGLRPRALKELRKMLTTAARDASAAELDARSPILRLAEYSADGLRSLMRHIEDNTTDKWRDYLARRQAGGEMELFHSREDAADWVERTAPVRLIDGAWLGHIHQMATPFALRPCTRLLWQILSEELGDGHSVRNHVHVYLELLESIQRPVPPPPKLASMGTSLELDDPGVWRSTVAHLLISIFPGDFLPELLGFTLHFESPALTTLIATHELKEVDIDPRYFLLHLTIDNTDSGHCAMALHAVIWYLEFVAASEGPKAVTAAWRRVQAGYLLSETVVDTKALERVVIPNRMPGGSRSVIAKRLGEVFALKAPCSSGLHLRRCVYIGGRTLPEWMAPEKMADLGWRAHFLTALAKSKAWVKPGNPEESRLVYEMTWGRKMFGAFTSKELDLLKEWISSLELDQSDFYDEYVRSTEESFGRTDLKDLADQSDPSYEGFITTASRFEPPSDLNTVLLRPWGPTSPYRKHVNLDRLIPLWFAHQCLLESWLTVPSRMIEPLYSGILRILRLQHGFGIQNGTVDGMDEIRCNEKVWDIFSIGMALVEAHEASATAPKSFDEVLERWPCEFAALMARLAKRPLQNGPLLLGMVGAFVNLHFIVAEMDLLAEQQRDALRKTAQQERLCMEACWKEWGNDSKKVEDGRLGFTMAEARIEMCFE